MNLTVNLSADDRPSHTVLTAPDGPFGTVYLGDCTIQMQGYGTEQAERLRAIGRTFLVLSAELEVAASTFKAAQPADADPLAVPAL